MQRSDSSLYQFVQRIPADVLEKTRGLVLSIPVGNRTVSRRISDKAKVVKVSLGTRDPTEAKIRQASVIAYLEGVWRALRDGPTSLSHKQAVTLAGEVYQSFVDAVESDPGSPALWQQVQAANELAQEGRYGTSSLMIGRDEDRQRASMEQRFGGFVDIALAKRGLVVDADSRAKVLEQVATALSLASDRLKQNAEGDYSPDANRGRFPAWENAIDKPVSPVSRSAAAVPLTELLEGWWTEAKANNKTESTYDSYSRTVRMFTAFLGHDDAQRVTADDVVAFKDHRLAQINPRTGKNVAPKTVKDTDLVALKSLYGWGIANRKVSSNPASDVTMKLGRKVRTRDKYFTKAEARAVLALALSYRKTGREHEKTAAAKRWVPWLCAYTGARVGEIAQLRKQDIRQEEGHWTLHITPEAGKVKDKTARPVPLHPHLIEQGFLSFVEASKAGYLFLSEEPGGTFAGRHNALKNRLQEFARIAVPDPTVQPNHAWRHTFKTIGLEEGIEGRVLDAIQGHAPRSQGESYGGVTIKARARAIEQFPRFDLT